MTDQHTEVQNEGSTETPALAIAPLRTSEQIDKLAEALSKAQGEMSHPSKNKVAKVPLKTGGSYSYNYADLADCIDAVRAPFAKHGLSFIQIPFNEGPNAVGIVTRILHASGQWIEGTLYMPCADAKPQTIGSAITYGRRYALSPMAGIASDDDDDGSAAQGVGAETGARQRGGAAQAGASRPANGLSEKASKMLGAFTGLGVTREQIEAHCGGTKLELMKDADLDALKELYTEVKKGSVKAADVGRQKAG